MATIKKTLLLTVVFMLAFTSSVFGMSPNNSNNLQLKQKTENVLPKNLANPENPDEKVRIIVELTNAPTIEKATQRGLLYKKLNKNERRTLEENVEEEQVSVQATIEKETPSIEVLESFTTVFNGFSAEVEAKFVEEIAATPGVKAVYESTKYDRPSIKPEMVYSKELVQAQQAWNDYNFRGEGMVVGIIDTGIDPSHKDMILSDNATAELTEEEVNSFLANGTLEQGQFYTEKVPFGYNYMDGNNEILDLGPDASMHGMHVAGTVGANGEEEGNGVKGVAPEAQLLALKVFGNDPGFSSTYGDIYIKAIDDAIKLGADVINMSLGATAGFVDDSSPEQQAVKRATDNGVLVAISAGNSALYGDGYFYPLAENQDYGLTGSPSVSRDSFGVASFENSFITSYSFNYQIDGAAAGKALYLLANAADPTEKFNGPVEVLDAGIGQPSDFEGKDFTGKIALVQRGTIGFVDKALNAQQAGAAGIIIYNNTSGTINMASDPAINIPYLFALQNDGKKLKEAINANGTVTVSFEGEFIETANPTAGEMSAFTSWGPTPNLDFKPEVTAPGGNIFSTLNDNKYGIMSGTSMAAPHVAGGAALILERIDNDFNLADSERVRLAKNLLMNTAKPVEFNPGEYVSPRRQGAGLMQLANALATDVVVTNEETGLAKVALKEIENNSISFTLQAQNYSDEEKTYNVDVAVQVDNATSVGGDVVTAPNQIGSAVVTEDVAIDTPEQLTIPANGSATLTVQVDVANLESLKETFTNGFFVDGFVTLTDSNEEVTGNVPLTVPFYGFNGEWDDARIFDYFMWEANAYWGYTGLVDDQGNFIDGDGSFNPDYFGFSPNGDGLRDKALPVFSLFRNVKNLKVEVLSADGKSLRTIRTDRNLTKNYISSNPYKYNNNYAWDGKINNQLAADGDYFLQVSGVIDYEGAEWQSIKLPVKVDTVAPTADATWNQETKTITVANFQDNQNGTGARKWQVLVNGEVVSVDQEDDYLESTETQFTIAQDIQADDKLEVVFFDGAFNSTTHLLETEREEEEEEDTTKPVIYIDSPAYFDAFNKSKVEVKGRVEDDSAIETLTINGKKADSFDGENFSHTLTLKDGVQDISVTAIDEFENKMQISRKVFVDTQAPKLSIKSIYPLITWNDTVKVKVSVQDNFDEIRVRVNGDERFAQDLSEPYRMAGFKKELELELSLVEGKNTFVIEVEDLVGHKTTKKIEIRKMGRLFPKW